ncbi:MAG: hypothetical protein LC798_21535 [Chloroflexi bacterium]|nr:hypothetical protein [Chloroflexota bacterium]
MTVPIDQLARLLDLPATVEVTGVDLHDTGSLVLTLEGVTMGGGAPVQEDQQVEGDWAVDQFGRRAFNFFKGPWGSQEAAAGPEGDIPPATAGEGLPGAPSDQSAEPVAPTEDPTIPEVPGQGNRRRTRKEG